jgi:hypothetical protein
MANNKAASTSAATKPSATKIIVVHGDKGGVGKSMVTMAVTDLLMAKGEKVAIIETDTTNPDVSRMFKSNVPTVQTNVRSEDGWMEVMDFVMKNPGYTFIMNTPAGIGENMKSDMESFVSFLKEHLVTFEMDLVWVMNTQHDSVNLLNKAYQAYGQFFSRLLVVPNLHWAGGDNSKFGPFVLWHESPLRVQIERMGGMTIYFPGLHVRVVAKLFDPEKVMPFSDAVDAVVGEALDLGHSERWKLAQWLKDVRAAFEPALAPSQSPEPQAA